MQALLQETKPCYSRCQACLLMLMPGMLVHIESQHLQAPLCLATACYTIDTGMAMAHQSAHGGPASHPHQCIYCCPARQLRPPQTQCLAAGCCSSSDCSAPAATSTILLLVYCLVRMKENRELWRQDQHPTKVPANYSVLRAAQSISTESWNCHALG